MQEPVRPVFRSGTFEVLLTKSSLLAFSEDGDPFFRSDFFDEVLCESPELFAIDWSAYSTDHVIMYFHSLSPYLWQISDGFGIQWNGLSYMLSFLVCFVFMGWMSHRQRSELVPKMLSDFIMICAIGALVGGRLGYCIFYAPDLFLKFRAEFPFWGVLAVGEGGMSTFGGVLGLVVASTIFAIRTGVARLYLYDLLALTGPIGIFFGRIANFLTGEFIGRPVDPSFPLAVKFPTEIFYWPHLDPARLVSLTPLVEKVGVDKEKWQALQLQVTQNAEAQTSVNEVLSKIVDSVQSGSADMQKLLEPLLTPRHPVQLYAAAGEGLLLFFFLFVLWYKPRRPGVVASTFLVLYSIIRFVDENYRMPDPQLGFGMMELTRGQWLSVGCFVIGLILLFVWGRRETLPTPGWGRGHSVKLHRR